MSTTPRAVSTVADVTLALVLISASVVTLSLYLETETAGDDYQPLDADRTAETLTVTTVSVQYSLAPLSDSKWIPANYPESTYRRSAHGSISQVLAEAAVANTKFPTGSGRERMFEAGETFERAVDGAVRSRLAGAQNNTQATAVWQPCTGSTIEGNATAGPTPPGTVDVSTATLTVPSGLPQADTSAIKTGYKKNSYVGAARPVARAIVQGLFPPEQMQISLEAQGFQRNLTVYRYMHLREILVSNEEISFTYSGAVTNREQANAAKANQMLVDALTQIIAEDLRRVHGPDATATEVAGSCSVNEVTIVVRTW